MLVQKLAHILLDTNSYSNIGVMCEIEPGIIFRIWKGRASLDVVVCFHCGQMYTETHDGKGIAKASRENEMTNSSHDGFARLAKQAFPTDPEIQKLLISVNQERTNYPLSNTAPVSHSSSVAIATVPGA